MHLVGVGPNKVIDLATLNLTVMHSQKLVPIILKLFYNLFATYYSQNYSSIIYKGLVITHREHLWEWCKNKLVENSF